MLCKQKKQATRRTIIQQASTGDKTTKIKNKATEEGFKRARPTGITKQKQKTEELSTKPPNGAKRTHESNSTQWKPCF